MFWTAPKGGFSSETDCIGAAWLSSARVVRCWLSPATSATPIISCHQVMLGTLANLLCASSEEGGTTSSHHGLYTLGYTRTTMVGTKGCNTAMWKLILKSRSSSIESATRLHEVGITSNRDQNVAVNTFPDLVHTARQTMEVGFALRQ